MVLYQLHFVAVAREEVWTRKYSNICECRDIFSEVEDVHFVPTEQNTYNVNAATRLSLPNLKKATNEIVKKKVLDKFNEEAQSLTFQGDFINLLQQEKQDGNLTSMLCKGRNELCHESLHQCPGYP
jgi:hypothetical protein